ncbi:MAG: helix-turn-helix transcriptional regulator [Verrucomicrobiales bacterium]
MVFKLLKEIARPQWMDILASIKRGQGKAVGEIAADLGTSYMGIKQHCDAMVKKGILDTFRRPRPFGRPEKIYRLTSRAQDLFPSAGNEVVLELLRNVGDIYGNAAPEKLLYNFFQNKTAWYRSKVKGKSVVERATALAKLRENEGYLSQIAYDNTQGLRIEEYHHPMEDLMRAYPVLLKAEERMIEGIVGSRVTREPWKHGGQIVQRFLISTL